MSTSLFASVWRGEGKQPRRMPNRLRAAVAASIEGLEPRLLLSATPLRARAKAHPKPHPALHVSKHPKVKKDHGGGDGHGDGHGGDHGDGHGRGNGHGDGQGQGKPGHGSTNAGPSKPSGGDSSGSTPAPAGGGSSSNSGSSKPTAGSGTSASNSNSSKPTGGSAGSGSSDSAHHGGKPTVPILRFGPTASISAADITSGGGASQTITVTYSDSLGVNAASISTGNISVSGPGGALSVTSAHAAGGSGAVLSATYTIAAPDGAWSNADNGSYAVSLNANSVADLIGLPAGGASGSFTVNVPAPVIGAGPADNTFASGQSVSTSFTTEAILAESNGQILAIGHEGSLSANQSRGVIERLNGNGTLDTHFGSHGQIVTPAGTDEAYYAAVQQDAGHFIVGGAANGDFVLERFDLNGNLDKSFGTNGIVSTDFGTAADSVQGLAIAPGGMIAAGGDSGGNFAFARYLANGQLDSSFAQNGRQLFGLGAGGNGLGNVAVRSNGDVVAVGAESGNVVVVQLTSAGEADGAFGKGGLVTVPGIAARTDLSAADNTEGLALQGDSILVANRTPDGHFGIVRVTSGGNADPTFGTRGLATANFGGDDDADSLVLQSTGEIIAIGTSTQGGAAQTAVAAFDPNGQLLTRFANKGTLTIPSGVSVSPVSASVATGAAKRKMSPGSLHVGDIVLRAFGVAAPDGRLVIGTSNVAPSASSASSGSGPSALRRLIVPGALVGADTDPGTLLGSFGTTNGKRNNLSLTDSDGTRITFSLAGGSGLAYQVAGGIMLMVNDGGRGMSLTVQGRGGDGRVALAGVTASGTLKSMNARTSDLSGSMHVTGAIGRLTLGNVSGNVFCGGSIADLNAGKLSGNLFAAGTLGRLRLGDVSGTIAAGGGRIATIQASSLDHARILSGANLGADGAIGGSGPNADSYGPGAIGAVRVGGAITSSVIACGVDPVDRTFGNSNDTVAGTGSGDVLQSITARSADPASLFEAGLFGRVRIGNAAVDTANDPRFRTLL